MSEALAMERTGKDTCSCRGTTGNCWLKNSIDLLLKLNEKLIKLLLTKQSLKITVLSGRDSRHPS